MREYHTKSGSYSEDDLAVVVWANPGRKSPQGRYLETMTSEKSRFPMVFPIKSLTTNKSWQSATIAKPSDDLFELIKSSQRSRPIIVPISLARKDLGWQDFYVPSEYTGLK